MSLLDKISALAFLAPTEDGQTPVNEGIDTQKLLDAKTEAAQVLEDLATALSTSEELIAKVETLQKANQQLQLENINLTSVATGEAEDDDLLSGIVVE